MNGLTLPRVGLASRRTEGGGHGHDAEPTSGCACCSRRQFLAGCGGLALAPSPARSGRPAGREDRIRVIYSLHAPVQPGPDWPNKGFDFRPVMERFGAELPKRCPGFEFLPTTASGPEEAARTVEDDAAVDGYLVFQMNCWNKVVQTVVPTGKPVLYATTSTRAAEASSSTPRASCASPLQRGLRRVVADRGPRGGGPVLRGREEGRTRVRLRRGHGKGADGVHAGSGRSRRPARSLKVVPTEEVLRLLGHARILAVRDDRTSGEAPSILGIAVENVTFAEVNEAWKAADREASRAVADRWQKNARVVEGVSRETLETSAAMYLGMKEVLRKHGRTPSRSTAWRLLRRHIHAYPCLGFHELCNEGLVGPASATSPRR